MPGVLAPTVHQLKIGLQGATPPLWRRIQIPSAASLGFLHDVIQMSFGWDGDHLHRFRDGRGREWGESSALDRGGYMAAGFADEEATALGKAMRAEGAVLEYLYDFGDSWLHRIEAEEITTLDPGVTYPRCTGGRRAAPPTEDIGGIWGLEEVVYLVTHPEADPPEHFEDLIRHLRGKGHDPGAFDPAELTARLSGLTVRLPAKAVRTRRRFQRLTSEDLEFCTCGRCQAGDPVRSVDGAYLSEKAPSEAEVFPVITLPARTELAAQARRVPLIEDALRLAEWCAPARQVTAKGVLKPPAARQAVEELRLWQRADELANPQVTGGCPGPPAQRWRPRRPRRPVAVRRRQRVHRDPLRAAVPGPGLPDPDDADQLLSCWQEAFEEELGSLDDMGARVLPGMLSMFGERLGSIVYPVLKLLYRLPDEERLDIGSLMSSLGADAGGSGVPMGDIIIIESTARLMKILSDFGAAEVDWGTTQWRSDQPPPLRCSPAARSRCPAGGCG